MSIFIRKPKGVWSLLNQVPFDGCLLVFNGCHPDWRSKACDFARRHGFKFSVHAIEGSGDKGAAHDRTKRCDLYVVLR